MNLDKIIAGCRQNKPKAQKQLYERFAASMYGVCRRYVHNDADAEDVFVEGMYKVMTRIDQYNGQGAFEGWMRRIFVNEALMFLRRNKRHTYVPFELKEHEQKDQTEDAIDKLSHNEIKELILSLPTGYRTVFNLYFVEGYKHREIAEMLGISINTSKSQLILARKKMREKILEMNNVVNKNYD